MPDARHSDVDSGAELVQIHTADTRGKHGSGFSFVSLREREQGRQKLCLGCSFVAVGSIGLVSRGLGLWSRKRHRQEVRAGLNILEMLYHHYQQGTVSHQGHKQLRDFEGCALVCVPGCCAGTFSSECISSVWQKNPIIVLPFHLHVDIV